MLMFSLIIRNLCSILHMVNILVFSIFNFDFEIVKLTLCSINIHIPHYHWSCKVKLYLKKWSTNPSQTLIFLSKRNMRNLWPTLLHAQYSYQEGYLRRDSKPLFMYFIHIKGALGMVSWPFLKLYIIFKAKTIEGSTEPSSN